MSETFFDSLFRNMTIPVIICRSNERLDVIYKNTSAKTLLDARQSASSHKYAPKPLCDVLRFKGEDFDGFCSASQDFCGISGFPAAIFNYEGELCPVSISCSEVEYENASYRVFYLQPSQPGINAPPGGDALLKAFQLSHKSQSTDDAIRTVLAFAGSHIHTSRAYIIETHPPGMVSNTYEWCADGVMPATGTLHDMQTRGDFYDELIRIGYFASGDIRKLDARDRAVLGRHGTKSIAVVPLFNKDAALGCICFDDCENYRSWPPDIIAFLKGLADIFASLIVRRDMENGQSMMIQILQTITNSSSSIVYVSDIATHELVFINRAMEDYVGKPAGELLGKPCWQVLHSDGTGPCDYCKFNELVTPGGAQSCEWEHKSENTGKWYKILNSIIKWTDGRDMHLSTLTEITSQKENEERLEHIASRDMMTGIYNRAWGYRLIENILCSQLTGERASLVFIDLDGLKIVNDTLGHDEGDRFIIDVVRLIQSNVRKSDALFRWGGDEFILILRCETPQAEVIMGNIQNAMAAFNASGVAAYTLSFSYGVVPLEADSDSVDSVISRADKLMYVNKASKRRFHAE